MKDTGANLHKRREGFAIYNRLSNVQAQKPRLSKKNSATKTIPDRRVHVENGEHKGKAGDGQFLKRGTCVNN
jgi:hypothetical protein